jgi:MoaA/NifB/PqqE/SkfB family radical SAM enzyme
MDTFCVLPWYSKEYSETATACCLLPPTHNLGQIKNDLLAGIQNESCNKCWKIEQNGEKSRRQYENEFLDFKLDRDLNLIQQDCADHKNQTILYQIKTSNLCNQACVSCSKSASTKWGELEYKYSGLKIFRFALDLDSVDIDYANAKRIEFVGGEPFFDQKTFAVLENLILHGNRDCYISIVTNGSVNLNQKQIDLLSSFKDLNLCISIDGIGPVFEYVRWPGKWHNLLENIQQYRKHFNINVSYTISGLNAFYYNETTKWFKDQKLSYNPNLVTWPQWLSLENAPLPIKQHFSSSDFLSNWSRTNGNEISIEKFRAEIIKQDQLKQISIRSYMPALADIIFDSQ